MLTQGSRLVWVLRRFEDSLTLGKANPKLKMWYKIDIINWYDFSELVLPDILKFISALNQMRQYCFYEVQWHHISEAEKVAFIIHPKKKQTNSINGHKWWSVESQWHCCTLIGTNMRQQNQCTAKGTVSIFKRETLLG